MRERGREEQNVCYFYVLLSLMQRKCILPTFANFKVEQLKKKRSSEHIPTHCPRQNKDKVVLLHATEVYFIVIYSLHAIG